MRPFSKIHPTDLHYANVDPDPDFDPEHNKRVIANTIRKNELLQRNKKRDLDDCLGERFLAIDEYIKSQDRGGSSSSIENYFGKSYLAYLKGMSLMDSFKKNAKKE